MISIFQFRFIRAYFTQFTTRNVYVLSENAVFRVLVILLSKRQSRQYSEWNLSKEQNYIAAGCWLNKSLNNITDNEKKPN